MLTNPGRKMCVCVYPAAAAYLFCFHVNVAARDARRVLVHFFLTDSHYSAFVLSRSPSPALPVNKTKTGVSHSTLA